MRKPIVIGLIVIAAIVLLRRFAFASSAAAARKRVANFDQKLRNESGRAVGGLVTLGEPLIVSVGPNPPQGPCPDGFRLRPARGVDDPATGRRRIPERCVQR